VDQLCARLFLLSRARTADSNIAFVANRFLHKRAGPVRTAGDVPGTSGEGGDVPNSETPALLWNALKISGNRACRAGATSRPKSDLCHASSTGEWIREYMPDLHAERQRQRAAYVRGLVRAGSGRELAPLVVGRAASRCTPCTRRGLVGTEARLYQKPETRLARGTGTRLAD